MFFLKDYVGLFEGNRLGYVEWKGEIIEALL